METVKLSAQPREGTGKGPARRLRVTNRIPAIVYGAATPPVSVSLASKDLFDILQSKRGRNTLITLEIDGVEPQLTMVRDFQIHPVKRKLVHCDLLRIKEDSYVQVVAPIVMVGKSQAEKLGGRARMVMREMAVRCLPHNIPASIEFDVTNVKTGRTVYAAEIPLPEGVAPAWKANFPVVVITGPKVEEAAGA